MLDALLSTQSVPTTKQTLKETPRAANNTSDELLKHEIDLLKTQFQKLEMEKCSLETKLELTEQKLKDANSELEHLKGF